MVRKPKGKALSLCFLIACAIILSGTNAWASESINTAEEVKSVIDSGDTTWILVSAALVMLMTPGLAFFYGGLVRRKNMLSVLMQCLMILCLVSLQWVLLGYSLSFGPDK